MFLCQHLYLLWLIYWDHITSNRWQWSTCCSSVQGRDLYRCRDNTTLYLSELSVATSLNTSHCLMFCVLKATWAWLTSFMKKGYLFKAVKIGLLVRSCLQLKTSFRRCSADEPGPIMNHTHRYWKQSPLEWWKLIIIAFLSFIYVYQLHLHP